MKVLAIGFCAFVAMAAAAHAELLGYWDFNGNYARSAGTMGSLTAELETYGIAYQDFGTGTTVNLLSGYSAGNSLRFFSLASIVEVGHITVAGLDFTGYSTPTVSFAARNTPAFQVGDEFYLEYDIGGGWTKVTDFIGPDTPFQLVTYTFAPGLLDGQPDVGIRITFSTVVNIVDTFEFDNLQINAVPEPGSLSLAALGLAGAGVLLRRKKAVSA